MSTKPPKKKRPKYLILWQKWEDPLTQMQNQIKIQIRNQYINQNLTPNGYNEENNQIPIPQIQSFPMMATPMGLFPAPIPNMSTFNFWIGHSNFKVTEPIWNILNNAHGIESLDLFSPYRFRISVGQAFNEVAVKRNIAQTVSAYLLHHA